jgi:hypothetical protein
MFRPIRLLAALLGLGVAMPAAAERPPPAWVVDPAAPGDNLPPVGRSLFDQLFASSGANGQAAVVPPFPFAALLARLDAELADDPASPLPPAKRVLIPLGRSLQRTAAAPEYFAYPRVVVAVDSEPAASSRHFLKDRLYLGYQEKSAVLEVISYNEAAGRFEFQLVKDYRAGGQPRVFYANRSLCFACHQNGAPIFSRALWDETNANPAIAAQLAASGHDFYGIPPGRGVDVPYAIDLATRRANGFALTQRLWGEGCGASDLPARRCRAGLFAAAVRHALADGQAWPPDAAFTAAVGTRIGTETQRRWPGGLAVGSSDLPNRNPLHGLKAWPAERGQRVAFSEVAARFEPLLPRPAQSIWQAGQPEAMPTLLGGLAGFISSADRRRLEGALASQPDTPIRRISLPCRITVNAPASRWSVHCSAPDGGTVHGTLTLNNGRPAGGQLNRLALPGGTALSNITLTPANPARPAEASFSLRHQGRLPHTAEGNAITQLRLQRDPNDAAAGQATLEIRDDMAAVDRKIAAILENPAGATLFGATPFPRQALLAALIGSLGGKTASTCCQAATALPAPQLEALPAGTALLDNSPPAKRLHAFYPYCATCHQSAESFPPNFLSGSADEVAARLRQCAPRLYVRLAMADLAADQRAKTPMPPESMLPAFATDVAGWQASPTRRALLAEVGQWLNEENGRPPDLGQLLAGGYEALRPCLPAP